MDADYERFLRDARYARRARGELDAEEEAAERERVLGDIPARPGKLMPDFLATASEEPEFEIPDLVPVASRVIITGEEGAGKSTLGRLIGVHHGAGVHPFTAARYDGGVSVIFDCENPPALFQMRLAELRDSLPADAAALAGERVVADSQPGGIDLAHPYWQEYLLRMVSGWKASLLVIGPLYKLCASLKPMSEEFFEAVSQFCDRLRAEQGCSLDIEAHVRQPVPGQIGRDMFPYGNTGWRRWPDAGMYLGRSGMLTAWRDNRYGTNVRWPVRLERVPGSQATTGPGYARRWRRAQFSSRRPGRTRASGTTMRSTRSGPGSSGATTGSACTRSPTGAPLPTPTLKAETLQGPCTPYTGPARSCKVALGSVDQPGVALKAQVSKVACKVLQGRPAR